VTKTVILRPN